MGTKPQATGALCAGVIGLVLLGLSGCGSSSDSKPAATAGKEACATMSVLTDAAELQRFRDGSVQGPDDLVYRVEVVDAKILCDKAVDGQVAAEAGISLYVRRGPAGKALTEVTIPYFVALTETNTQVISRAVYTTTVALPKDKNSGGVVEHLSLTIPLNGKSPYSFEVVTGIQLSAAELAAERKRLGR
ncbi:hypothetical protein [Zavarzinia sp.]|uniref:hypothetical protein n=1 Tax=Zavarzinia sp. TaxID=2027920 RepID=UPI0035615639